MALVLLLLAFGPSLIWAYWIWSRDKFRREPLWLIGVLLVSGAVISVEGTLLFNDIFRESIPSAKTSIMLNMLFSAAFPEELFKMLPVLIFAWRSKHWDEPFDGIVYAGASALGFHLRETYLYMFNVGKTVDGALYQGLIRGSKPGHMLYGIVMGYFLSRAKFGDPKDRWKNFALALAVPVALHTAWNTAGGHGGGFVAGNSTGELIVSLLAWGLSVALWVTAFRYMREARAVQTVPLAPTGCHYCGSGYPTSATYCQRCGAQVQALPQSQ